jgi:hypothetical protein
MVLTARKWMYLLITGLALALVAGCSSDSNPAGTGGGGPQTGAIPLQDAALQPPAAMQSAATADTAGGAARAVAHFDRYNSIGDLAGWFTAPSPVRGLVSAALAAEDTTRWTVGELEVTLAVISASSETYSYVGWDVILNGSDEFNTYSDFLFITGNQTTDVGGVGPVSGSGGEDRWSRGAGAASIVGSMIVYDRANPPYDQYQWTWGTDPLGVTIGSFGWGLLTDPEDVGIQFNADGSGFLTYSQDLVVRYRATWQASGSGTWTTYDDSGTQIGTGTW